MTRQSDILAPLRRQYLMYFVMKVFDELHPGAPPLGVSWYLEAICHALEAVEAGHQRRLVITVPPRHLKSITASVAFVAWALGRNPSLKIMVATYSHDLARQHAEHCRRVMKSSWYQKLFPAARISDSGDRALELLTTKGGGRKAVSVGGSTTGFGADLIIVDDCMKADEARSQVKRDEVRAWLDGTLMTRLNDQKTGAIVSIQQRLHEDDLPAYMLEKGYAHLNLPAIAGKVEEIPIGRGDVYRRQPGDLLDPERHDTSVLDQLRRELGPVVFSAQYQQTPVAPEGNLLRFEWFRTYEEVEERSWYNVVVQSWDTAATAGPRSDYSVCTTWGFRDKKWYLLDLFRERLEYPDLKRAVIRLQRKWRADEVLVEDAGTGTTLWQELRQQGPFVPICWRVTQDKETRFVGTFGEVEGGHILIPEEAPWLADFRSELKAFPQGRYDDQVDSFSQFVEWQIPRWLWAMEGRTPDGRRPLRRVRERERPW